MAAHIDELILLDWVRMRILLRRVAISDFASSVRRKVVVANNSSKHMLVQRVERQSNWRNVKCLGTRRFRELLGQTGLCRNCRADFSCYMESYNVLTLLKLSM